MAQTDQGHRPLAGVRVLGLEQSVAGPLCTRILADMGADVIKVERAGSGDFARHWDDHVEGESGQFWWLNRAKGSVALDLRDPLDRRDFDLLVEEADVLVHNMSPSAAARLGLDAVSIASSHPTLVSCQISGYGASSPFADRKAYDMLVQAESGIMSLTGTPDTPSRVGVSLCDVATGMYAAILVLGALRRREHTGVGSQLDVAMFDVGLEFVGPMLTSYLNSGTVYERAPQHHHAIAPYGVFRCADGDVVIAIEQDIEWRRFVTEVLDRDDLLARDDLGSNLDRIARRDEVNDIVDDALQALPRDEVVRRLSAGQFAFASLNDVTALSGHPVASSRGSIRDVENASGHTVRVPVGMGERLFAGEPHHRLRPPDLDEDRPRRPSERASTDPGAGSRE